MKVLFKLLMYNFDITVFMVLELLMELIWLSRANQGQLCGVGDMAFLESRCNSASGNIS